MEKRPIEKETTGNQKKGKIPIQPDKPVENVTSSDDSVRRPDHQAGTSPEDQTKGNP